MGCTSSAPNMSDLQQHSHTTENEKKERHDDKQEDENLKKDTNEKKDSKQNESTNVECNEIKMLPTCDTLDENLQLDRKAQDIVTNEQERDMNDLNDTEVNVSMEIEKEIPIIELQEEPHKLLSFEDVVNGVVSEGISDDIAYIPGIQENEDKTPEENAIQDNPIQINNESSSCELEEINDDEDNLGEMASQSPSQSECSRATRWEALADIAAELPPSLTVDPLTGQIFSLTK